MNHSQHLTALAIRHMSTEQNDRNGHRFCLSQLDEKTASLWRARLFPVLAGLGITKDARSLRLGFLSLLLDRPISTCNDLTWPECQAIIQAAAIPFMKDDLIQIVQQAKENPNA